MKLEIHGYTYYYGSYRKQNLPNISHDLDSDSYLSATATWSFCHRINSPYITFDRVLDLDPIDNRFRPENPVYFRGSELPHPQLSVTIRCVNGTLDSSEKYRSSRFEAKWFHIYYFPTYPLLFWASPKEIIWDGGILITLLPHFVIGSITQISSLNWCEKSVVGP